MRSMMAIPQEQAWYKLTPAATTATLTGHAVPGRMKYVEGAGAYTWKPTLASTFYQKVWPDDDMCDESLDCVLSHLTVLAGSESAYLC